jgi:hypothetical protein
MTGRIFQALPTPLFFFFLMGFVFCDSYYPTDRGGPARVARASRGGPTWAGKDRTREGGTGEEGSDEMGGTGGEEPGEGKLDGCIMH